MKPILGLMAAVAATALILSNALGGVDAKEMEKAAVAASGKWLGLVDSGKYEESWAEAAENFRHAVPKENWVESLNVVRKPLGDLVSRKVSTTKYTKELPGAPDGEYVVIQFKTSFKNKKEAIETVTPMKEKDGVWRVSGYYIK